MATPMRSICGLIPGQTYRVVKPFTDYDGIVHSVGETWIFEKTNFVPYNDGLTLHVIKDGHATVYRLQWIKEQQEYIIEHSNEFIVPCS